YMRYMLDLYVLLEFECSPEHKEALLNNFLFNLDMVKRRGGDFDDKFYRKTISPNVLNFLQIKANIESAFDLKRRSKSHTSPHLRDETKILLQMYKEDKLHLFRSGRSMGHAALNRFDRGYQRLADGKMNDYLKRSSTYAKILTSMESDREKLRLAQGNMDVDIQPR
ncbi:hypothetical protein B0H17DRAFT_953361, partial [Mycena rosella]